MRTVEWIDVPRSNRLGGVGVGVIPWQCWDTPGFKDCHAEQFAFAKEVCSGPGGELLRGGAAQGGSVEECTGILANEFSENACVPTCQEILARTPPPSGPPPSGPPPSGPPPTSQPCPGGQRRDVASGQCVAITCPAGQQLNPTTNQCEIPPTTTTTKKKTNWGLALLGAAAVIAGAYAIG